MNRKLAVFVALGFEAVFLVAGLVFLGRYFDQQYGWGGVGAGFGAFLGMAGWVIHLLVAIKAIAKEDDSRHTDSK